MKKHIAAACLFGTALAATPAFAQDSSSSSSSSMNATSSSQTAQGGVSGQFLTQMTADEWRGSKLVGVDVYGSDNSKIGDINEVIVDRNGQAKAIVIGVGGFLGIGEKNVAIPWDKVQWNTGGNQSSGSMVSNTSAGGQPAGDRSTPRDVAQTTTGSPSDANAQPAQSAAAGGATLSSAPSSGTTANAPANSSASVASAPSTSSTSSASSSGSSAGAAVTASGSAHSQDYPDRALVSMSKQDLQNAPDFHYASQASGASGSAKGGSGGSSLTGSASGR